MTGPVSLHVERLVVDEALLAPGGERQLGYALIEALEQVLPGTIAGATQAELSDPAVPASREGASGHAGLADRAPVAAGNPSLLAEGVAQRVAAQVRSAVASGGGAR